MLNTTNTVNESLGQESMMESCQTPQYSAISEHSTVKGTPQAIREWLMSSVQGSHASLSPKQENNSEKMTQETCGLKQSQPFALLDPDTASWRTCQVSFLTNTLALFSETFPKAGMMRDGKLYRQRKWEPQYYESEYSLWPSPVASLGLIGSWSPKTAAILISGGTERISGASIGTSLEWEPRLYPDWVRNGEVGTVNPRFPEYLMGWMDNWTDLKPLEMDKFRQWLEQHGKF